MKRLFIILVLAVSCTKQTEKVAPVTNTLNKQQQSTPASAAATYSTESQAEAAADASFGIAPGTTTSPQYTSSLVHNTTAPPVALSQRSGSQAYQRAACTQPGGYYATGITHGSIFSSFLATFSLKDGNGVDDFGLVVSGLALGWSWTTISTSYYGTDAGTTVGTATFTYGVISWSFTYALNWKVGRNNCTFVYTWKNMSA